MWLSFLCRWFIAFWKLKDVFVRLMLSSSKAVSFPRRAPSNSEAMTHGGTSVPDHGDVAFAFLRAGTRREALPLPLALSTFART